MDETILINKTVYHLFDYMAYRKFKGIEYPVPGVDTAINTLRPGARCD